MSLTADIRVLRQFLRGSGAGRDHAERLEQFYSLQAEDYDRFRERLLPGRRELISGLPIQNGFRVIDFGGGTGANLEFLPEKAHAQLARWTIVDLSPSLLRVARQRANENAWSHVILCEDDACRFQPEAPPDLVLFSYSLTMIPDWIGALDNAFNLLKPGGYIALVDFTVSRKFPPEEVVRHSSLTRMFWPLWFSWDNVFLNPDHLPYLLQRFSTVRLEEHRTRLPYLPGSRVPYYLFVGQKRV
ncbi:MAG: class I SAM-dependent methyltransferase [Pseudomonadota bacterium]